VGSLVILYLSLGVKTSWVLYRSWGFHLGLWPGYLDNKLCLSRTKNPHESVHIRVDIVLKTVHYALFLQLYAEQYTVFVSMLHSLLPTVYRTVSFIRLANSQQHSGPPAQLESSTNFALLSLCWSQFTSQWAVLWVRLLCSLPTTVCGIADSVVCQVAILPFSNSLWG